MTPKPEFPEPEFSVAGVSEAGTPGFGFGCVCCHGVNCAATSEAPA
jgi:hypothetical protein